MTDEDLTARLDAIDEQIANVNQGINTILTQQNAVAPHQQWIDLLKSPNGLYSLIAAMKGCSAFSIIPAGQVQTTANAVIKKGSSWDYSIGRNVVIECAAWGINLSRTITEKSVSADGRYVSLSFNTPLPLPLAENDRIYPLPW